MMVGLPKVCTSVSEKSLPSVGIMGICQNYRSNESPSCFEKLEGSLSERRMKAALHEGKTSVTEGHASSSTRPRICTAEMEGLRNILAMSASHPAEPVCV